MRPCRLLTSRSFPSPQKRVRPRSDMCLPFWCTVCKSSCKWSICIRWQGKIASWLGVNFDNKQQERRAWADTSDRLQTYILSSVCLTFCTALTQHQQAMDIRLHLCVCDRILMQSKPRALNNAPARMWCSGEWGRFLTTADQTWM